MTEKIIIDCAFYKDGVCASPINKTCEYCKNIDVSKCYHKQLKRLEQKNKDLKKQIESDKGLITVGGKQQYQYLQRIDELEQENKELLEARNHFMAINLKYFNALEEIRKIASPHCSQCVEILNKINEVLE